MDTTKPVLRLMGVAEPTNPHVYDNRAAKRGPVIIPPPSTPAVPVNPPNRYKVTTSSLNPSRTAIVDTTHAVSKEMAAPKVYFTPDAMAKMKYIVDVSPLEVSWMSLVKNPAPGIYLIYEVCIPKQTVTSVEADIDGDGMGELAMELLDAGHDTGEMYAWFHSHVNMGVTPSGQDELQVAEFLESCPVFIRGIMNKKGNMKVDVYFTEENVAFNAVETEVFHPPLNADEKAEIDATILERVKTRVYARPPIQNFRGGQNFYGNQNYANQPYYGNSKKKRHAMFDDEDGFRGTNAELFDEETPLNSTSLTSLATDDPADDYFIVDTGYGDDWNESTPISLRPAGWQNDDMYLIEGKNFDAYVY